jgi:hypothetical protein
LAICLQAALCSGWLWLNSVHSICSRAARPAQPPAVNTQDGCNQDHQGHHYDVHMRKSNKRCTPSAACSGLVVVAQGRHCVVQKKLCCSCCPHLLLQQRQGTLCMYLTRGLVSQTYHKTASD